MTDPTPGDRQPADRSLSFAGDINETGNLRSFRAVVRSVSPTVTSRNWAPAAHPLARSPAAARPSVRRASPSRAHARPSYAVTATVCSAPLSGIQRPDLRASCADPAQVASADICNAQSHASLRSLREGI